MTFFLRRPAPIGLVLTLLSAFACATSADVVTTVAATPTVGGGDSTATVYFLNTGSTPESISVPATVGARLQTQSSGTSTEVTLRRDTQTPDATRIEPGRFFQAVYHYTRPTDAAVAPGDVTLTLLAPANAVAVPGPNAEPPSSVAAAESDGRPHLLPTDTRPSGLPNEPALTPHDSGIAETVLPRFSPHEPIYFIAGPDRPNAKFQISFKYQLFNPEGAAAQAFEPLAGLHIAYSQTSFWDWEGESAPFFDNSYRPELLWSAPDLRIENSLVSRLGLQAGIQHESNGRDGIDSRSLNIVYVRPSVTFGDPEGFFITFAPKVYGYVFSKDSGNDDIENYRGYADLRLIVGEREGLQLAVTGRVGDDWDKGSVQFDLSYPLRRFFGNSVDLYLYGQYFVGFGESLLEYNEYTNRFRLGVAIVR